MPKSSEESWKSPVDPSWGILETCRRAREWDVSHFTPCNLKLRGEILPDISKQKVKPMVAAIYMAMRQYGYYYPPKRKADEPST